MGGPQGAAHDEQGQAFTRPHHLRDDDDELMTSEMKGAASRATMPPGRTVSHQAVMLESAVSTTIAAAT